jgi:hypothetical protein
MPRTTLLQVKEKSKDKHLPYISTYNQQKKVFSFIKSNMDILKHDRKNENDHMQQ